MRPMIAVSPSTGVRRASIQNGPRTSAPSATTRTSQTPVLIATGIPAPHPRAARRGRTRSAAIA